MHIAQQTHRTFIYTVQKKLSAGNWKFYPLAPEKIGKMSSGKSD